MSNTIILNSNNVVSGSDYMTYEHKFILGGLKITEGSTLSIRQVSMPYSWFNVNATKYNNNVFTYTWVDDTVYTVTLDDGFYLTSDLNNALQLSMIENGLYLINADLENVYYLELLLNTSKYSVQIVAQLVPTALPAGYTEPSNIDAGFYPGVTETGLITISATNNFGSIIGYSAGSYPAASSATSVSFESNIVPNGSPVNSIVMRCNLISNNVSFPSDVLDSFTFTDTTFGSNGNYRPNYAAHMEIKTGTYNNMVITFVDQNFEKIIARDPNVTITLVMEIK